jgi:predicted nucleotidyltransferase
MGTDELIERLRFNRDRLSELGVAALSVFGSVARGDARPDSDIDLLVDFNGPATFDTTFR